VSEQIDINSLKSRIGQSMLTDRFQLRRLLDSVQRAKGSGRPFDRNLKRLTQTLDRSVELRQRRASGVPTVQLNEELPIAARRADIEQAIRDNQVIIVCGETGSGKSTQLPMICLGMGRGIDGMIGHTQPRRIAARSVSSRVAQELGSTVGSAVGFKVRFTDATSPTTYIKLMTDGILLAESQGDRFFDRYDTIIIDEAHERSLNIDFLLGRMKQLLPRRRDLKLIITSATIDAARFAEHFGTADEPAPVIEVAGRTYPVEVRYRPPVSDDDGSRPGESGFQKRRRGEADIQTAILDAVDELGRIDQGDILIFLPTERDILETARSLRGRLLGESKRGRPSEILPLYARLSNKDQNRIFQPGPHRRIVIATNVAESSLTVPRIRSVIDTGTARISRYSARSRMQRLPIEPISRASADQRAGRCGRVGPGICIRLYSEDDYNSRDDYTAPEIQRTNLASVILQTAAFKLGPLEEFPFLEPPRCGTITDGYRTLFELGALDEKNELTDIGRQLSRLPVDPRVGRIVVAANENDCLSDVLVIAAALELQDPRERPIDQQQAADEAHKKFQDENSDFLSYLKLWDFYHAQRSGLSRGKLRKACQQNFLSYNRMREWVDVYHQLAELAGEAGLKAKNRRNESEPIHRSLLTGFLANIALQGEGHEFLASGNQRVSLWPGSGLFGQKPKWIVAAELVETTRRYVRTVARIKPEWIEPLAGHLITRTHSDPEWDARAGSAMAFKKVTLFGLPVVPRRRVRYAKINPEQSREMMIRHGLVEGDLETDLSFFSHNQRLLDELDGLQTRTRRSDLVIDEDARFDFYEARIPHDIADVHALKRWLKGAARRQQKPLHMAKDDLRQSGTEEVTGVEFPDQIQVAQMRLSLEYHLEPGSPEDGVSIAVPREALNQLDQRRLGWLVPGLIEEKVVALIRSLPKSARRQFVPAAETAREVVSRLKFGDGGFEETVARHLSKIASERISVSDFDLSRLPGHLRMNVRVVDTEGETLALGRDISSLRSEMGRELAKGFEDIDDGQWTRDGITDWDFGELPAQVSVHSGGVELKGYPTLLDRGESVSLRLFDLPARSAIETRAGLRRLAAIALRRQIKQQLDNIPDLGRWTLDAATLGCANAFRPDIGDLIADRAFFPAKGPYPRTEIAYRNQLKRARGLMGIAVQDVVGLITPLMSAHRDLRRSLKSARSPQWAGAVQDIKQQIGDLTTVGFLTKTPWGWLRQYPRYFAAACARLEKLPKNGVPRDRGNQDLILACMSRWKQRAASHSERDFYDPQLDHYRWLIEEFRVSLFAQQLGTAMPVSEQRLEAQWAKVAE